MISAKDFLKYKYPELNQKLEQNVMRANVTEVMEQYALEVAEDLVKNCNAPAVSKSVSPEGREMLLADFYDFLLPHGQYPNLKELRIKQFLSQQ